MAKDKKKMGGSGQTKNSPNPPKSSGGSGNGQKPAPIKKKDIGKVW